MASAGSANITIGYDGTNFPVENITYALPITFYSNIDFKVNDTNSDDGSGGRSTEVIALPDGNLCVHWAVKVSGQWRSYLKVVSPVGATVKASWQPWNNENISTIRMASHPNTNRIAIGSNTGKTKLYDTNWNVIASDTISSSQTGGVQASISNVAMNSLGTWCVSLYTYGGSWGTEGNPGLKAYNSSGSQTQSAFRVADDGSQTQSNPWVNALTGNNFCYTFNTIRGGRHYTPKLQMFNSNGNQSGSEKWVATNYTGRQYSPTNFALANGNWVATWKSNHPGGSTSFSLRSTKQNVYARIFNSSGNAVSSEFRVNNTQWNGNGSPWGEPYQHDSDTFRIMFSAPTDQSRYSAGGQWERPFSYSGSSQGNDYRANTYGTEKGNNHAYISDSDGGSRAYTWIDGSDVKIRSKNVWG